MSVYTGTGTPLRTFATEAQFPQVFIGQMVPGGLAEVGVVSRAVSGPRTLVEYDSFDTVLRRISTTYDSAGISTAADGIAVGPTGTVVVANV